MKNRFIRVTIVTCIVYVFYVFFFTENVEDVSSNKENFIQINSVINTHDSLVNIKDTLNLVQKNNLFHPLFRRKNFTGFSQRYIFKNFLCLFFK